MSSLLEKIKSANSTSSGIEKAELVDEIIGLFKKNDAGGMKCFFEAYKAFLLRFSEESECETVFRAQRNMDHLTKIADMVCLGRNYFEAEENVKKGPGLSFPGPVRTFYHDSIGYKMIELPGFQTGYNGALYYEDKQFTAVRPEHNLTVRNYVFLRRYVLPTKSEIADYLQQKAAPLQNMEISNPDYNILSPLEREIMQLSFAVKKELASGKNLDFVKSLLPEEVSGDAPKFQERGKELQERLHVMYTALPLNFVEENRRAGHIKGFGWFSAALMLPIWNAQNGLGILWALQLPKEECLGGKTNFKFIDLSAGEIDEAKKVLNAVYAALPSEEHFKQVFEASSIRLEEWAYILIKSLQRESEVQKTELNELLAKQPISFTAPGNKGNN